MKQYWLSPEDALRELSADRGGLSAAEAARRFEEHGANKLAEPKKDSLVKRFLKQLADPMILILLAAAAVSAITSVYAGEGMAPSSASIRRARPSRPSRRLKR